MLKFWLSILLVWLAIGANAVLLPPRLTSNHKELHVTEGQRNVVLECTLDVGDDPVSYRWLKQHKLVTADLGFAYRTFRRVHLALHEIRLDHAGRYECEGDNDAGVDAQSIEVFVDPGDFTNRLNTPHEIPVTSDILSELSASLNDVLAEGRCDCDIMFLMHASPDAEGKVIDAQANFVYTVGQAIISKKNRVSVLSYSDYTVNKLSFTEGTDACVLRDSLHETKHKKWSTRLEPVLREAFKKFKKSKKECKVLFLQIFGSLGTEGPSEIVSNHLKKIGVKIFIFEVTPEPLNGVKQMASTRGDGHPYHWWIPLKIWPTIVSYMNYMPEELFACLDEQITPSDDYSCLESGSNCTKSSQCKGIGFGCVQGTCTFLECNVNPSSPGCCSTPGDFWCGDVTLTCLSQDNLCDGRIQCMNGQDEERCWQNPCAPGEARCQSSTLCLSIYDLCDGEPQCPSAEDEDPIFCRSFPCPNDRKFRCRNGKCISDENVCDGTFRDCGDGEDEGLAYCSSEHVCPSTRPFKCDYGICMPERMVCDGAYNCLDAEDEKLCDDRKCQAKRPFKCGDGTCVDLALVCNGVVDACNDGSDELNCDKFVCPATRSFKCLNGRCIDHWLTCDQRNDCGDNTDELHCSTTTPSRPTQSLPDPTIPTDNSTDKPAKPIIHATPRPIFPAEPICLDDEFYCKSGICLDMSKVCDGRRNCIDGEDEDEDMCKIFPCPVDRPHRCSDNSCVHVVYCDGFPDCKDGSDEEDCTVFEDVDYDEDDYDDDDDEITFAETETDAETHNDKVADEGVTHLETAASASGTTGAGMSISVARNSGLLSAAVGVVLVFKNLFR